MEKESLKQKLSRFYGHYIIALQKPFLKIIAKLKYKEKAKWKRFYRDILTAKQKRYLARYLFALSEQPRIVEGKENKTIWFCWLQGEKNAPPVIAKCLQSIRKYCPDYKVVILTWDNITKYADIPNFIYEKHKKGMITNTQFSDLLRLALLTQNGGMWIDATVFLTEPLPTEISQAEFFAFHSDNYVHSNSWLIKANTGNIVLEKLKRLMFAYWQTETKMLDYFLYHLFFDLLIEKDDECAQIWSNVPLLYDDRYDLEYSYFAPYDERKWQRLKRKTSIHKLSWKYKKQPTENCFLAYLLAGKLN